MYATATTTTDKQPQQQQQQQQHQQRADVRRRNGKKNVHTFEGWGKVGRYGAGAGAVERGWRLALREDCCGRPQLDHIQAADPSARQCSHFFSPTLTVSSRTPHAIAQRLRSFAYGAASLRASHRTAPHQGRHAHVHVQIHSFVFSTARVRPERDRSPDSCGAIARAPRRLLAVLYSVHGVQGLGICLNIMVCIYRYIYTYT